MLNEIRTAQENKIESIPREENINSEEKKKIIAIGKNLKNLNKNCRYIIFIQILKKFSNYKFR